MNKIFFILIITISIQAQQKVRVTYETIRTFPDNFFNRVPEDTREEFKLNFSKPYKSELISDNDASVFKSINSKAIVVPSTQQSTKTNINMGLSIPAANIWYKKNNINNKIIKLVELDKKKYYIETEIVRPKLILAPGSLKIDRFNCSYAYAISTKNVSDTIKYWYTTEIPLDDSPTNESGFPGLVLKTQSKNATSYAVKIEFLEDVVLDELNNDIGFIKPEDLQKLQIEMMKPSTTIDSEGNKKVKNVIKMGE